jgi:hypothetical protein
MTAKYWWCTVLMIALSVVLVAPPRASGEQFGYGGPAVGPIVGRLWPWRS